MLGKCDAQPRKRSKLRDALGIALAQEAFATAFDIGKGQVSKAEIGTHLSLLSSVSDKCCIEVGCSAAEKPYPSSLAARGCRQSCSSCNCSCTQHSAHFLRVHLTALVDAAISAVRNPLRGSQSRSEVRLKDTRDALQTRNVIRDAVRSFVHVVFSSAASASWRKVPCRRCVRIA